MRTPPLSGVRWASALAYGAMGLLAGMLEAGLATLAASVALALSAGSSSVELRAFGLQATPEITAVLLVGLVAVALRFVALGILAYVPARENVSRQTAIRTRLLSAFSRADPETQSRQVSSQLQEALTTHAGRCGLAIQSAYTLISSVSLFVAMTAVAVTIGRGVAVTIMFATGCLFFAFRPVMRRVQAYAATALAHGHELVASAAEFVGLATYYRIFGVEDAGRQRLLHQVEALDRPLFRSQAMVLLVGAIYSTAILGLVFGGLLTVAHLPTLNFAGLTAAILILARALSYAQQAQSAYAALLENAPYERFVSSVLTELESAHAKDSQLGIESFDCLELNGVDFSYPDGRMGLRQASLTIRRGEFVAIVGPSGSGKSTLLSVILGLKRPQQGTVKLNGVDLHEFSREQRARLFSMVSQDPKLLRGTVLENILFLRPFDESRAKYAAEKANVLDEIQHMPDGLNQAIGGPSDGVSGGQRQRITLARALLGDNPIIALDEITSALDVASAQMIMKAISALRVQGKTVIATTHDPAFLGLSDKIVEVQDGSVTQRDGPWKRE